MVFNKNKRNNNVFKKEDQLVWKNTTHEISFNPEKKYYGLIKIGEHLFYNEYKGKFRSEAKAILEEEARTNGGKLDTFGVLK